MEYRLIKETHCAYDRASGITESDALNPDFLSGFNGVTLRALFNGKVAWLDTSAVT